MSFNVTLYNARKKVNSTARPTSGQIFQCIAKGDLDITKPIISLNLGLTSPPTNYNYAYISTFDRYYFIDSWTFSEALWHAQLSVDVLATYKSEIGSSNQYILRSASDYNIEVGDSTYPTTNVTELVERIGTSPWITDSMDNGRYVVGISGQSTTYYLFSKSTLDFFFEWLFSDLYADALVGSFATVFPQLKVQCNPLQYITSIMWLPFVASGTPVETIRVGWVDVPVVAQRVDGSGVRSGIHTFTIDRHPQSSRGAYLNNAPYSSYTLFYPPWGTITLDPDIMANSSTLHIIWNIDLRTGKGTMTISGDEDGAHIMSWVHSQVGVPYQVSQVLNNGTGIGSIIQAVASTGVSVGTGNAIGAFSSGMGAIENVGKNRIPSVSTVGSMGGIDSLRGNPSLISEFKTIVAEDIDDRGRPLCEKRVIGTLSGFVLVADAHMSISGATREETEMVNNLMEGGFYYE